MSGEQLTPREAEIWARTRRQTMVDVEVEFHRYVRTAEGRPEGWEDHDLAAAEWAYGIVAAARVRLDRILGDSGLEELPAAPCSIPGVYAALPVLCGYDAAHAGRHSWARIPLPVVCPVPWWRRR